MTPIGWTIFYLAPIGQLLQVALEHASECLINATATGTEILKSLVLSYLCFFPLLASYWLDNIYPCSHWSITSGCPGARQRVPNQRHGHLFRDTQVPDPVLPLFFSPTRLLLVGQYLPLLPLVNYFRLPWRTPACA
jgi:hypothetical protein